MCPKCVWSLKRKESIIICRRSWIQNLQSLQCKNMSKMTKFKATLLRKNFLLHYDSTCRSSLCPQRICKVWKSSKTGWSGLHNSLQLQCKQLPKITKNLNYPKIYLTQSKLRLLLSQAGLCIHQIVLKCINQNLWIMKYRSQCPVLKSNIGGTNSLYKAIMFIYGNLTCKH